MVIDTPALKAISSVRRREILRLVWSDELEAGVIHRAMPDVTFGAVAQHLRTLLSAGLVHQRAEGRHRLYRARREALGPVARSLEATWSDALWRLKVQAELLESRRGPSRRARQRPASSRSEH